MDTRHLIDVSKNLTHAMQDILVDKYELDQMECAYVLAMSIHIFTQAAKNRVAFQNYLDKMDITLKQVEKKVKRDGVQH